MLDWFTNLGPHAFNKQERAERHQQLIANPEKLSKEIRYCLTNRGEVDILSEHSSDEERDDDEYS